MVRVLKTQTVQSIGYILYVLIRQVISQKQKKLKTSINQGFQRCLLASQTGIEPATFRLGELQPIVTLCQSEVR